MTSSKETSNIFSRRISQTPIFTYKNPIFNSQLFIDLDSNFTQSQEDSTSSEDETFQNIEDDINNKGCYLNKELIDELDSPILEQNENNNGFDQNLIWSLVKNGYEYIPKKYQFQQKKINNKNNKNNKIKNYNCNQQKNNKKVIKERKGDWVCQFCSNVNFAFRTICNRCKGRKEECLQTIIM
jgi:hypothetical protein